MKRLFNLRNIVCFFMFCIAMLTVSDAFAQTIRFVIGKYDCFEDSDCENGYCDLNSHKCIRCYGDQIMVDKECVCPEGTHTYGNYCIECNEPNEIWDGARGCLCNEQEDYHSIGGICQMCPIHQVWNGSNTCVCDETERYYLIDNECQQCPSDKPYWNKSTCVPCLKNPHCAVNYQCESDLTYTCYPCPTNLIREKDEEQCRCPDGMGLTQKNDSTPFCLKYCDENAKKMGLILVIDRSASTKNGKLYTYIDTALTSLEIPYADLDTAVYFDVGGGQKKVANPVSYGQHSHEDIKQYFSYETRGFRGTPDGTDFRTAFNDIYENVCVGQKLIVMLWTDAASLYGYKDMKTALANIKIKCPGSKFYFVAPSDKFSDSVVDKFFSIKSLPETYATILNEEIEKEACIKQKK